MEPTRPGLDPYTLRAVVELEVALEAGVAVDAAHAVVGDLALAAFGPGVFGAIGEALAEEGRPADDWAVLLADDALADRVLGRLRERTGDDAGEGELVWSAYPPGSSPGREGFRRAVRRRRENALTAAVRPRRHRVAGRRRRD
ncbi:hypothetical protein [Geodermatophilus sp. FMUSA9-8]|uniref:hypothetical protein n=1 Tax=Geodermatophilus sp. FMUSA9-8 TaxID=3120155 RepID=UPI003008BEF9